MVHGGNLPAVQDAARRRIYDSAETMVEVLKDIATNPGMEAKDRINAAKDLLDRAGYGAAKKVEHSGEVKTGPSEEIQQMILAERKRRRAEGAYDITSLPPRDE